MGFIENRTIGYRQTMTAKDYIRLAMLGALERTPLGLEEAILAVGALTGPAWIPVSQLVSDALDEMVDEGLLSPTEGAMPLTITGQGRRVLHDLIARPLAAPLSPFGQVGIRLKLAFLDLVPPVVRRRQIDAILRSCECELASRTVRCPAWALNGALGRVWLDHQVEALEEMASMLRGMARATEAET